MAIKAITDLNDSWFTPEDQQGEEHPARFLIKPLNGLQHADIISELRQTGDTFGLTSAGIAKTLKYGLKDWEGVEGNAGALPYEQKNLKYLPGDYHHLIAAEIISKSTASEEDIKK